MAIIISDSANPKYGTSVKTIAIANGGTGYTVNDVLTLVGGDNNATVTVTSVSSGVVTGISRTAVGSGYTAGTYGVTGGTGGDDATITITCQQGFGTVNGWYRCEAANMGSVTQIGTSSGNVGTLYPTSVLAYQIPVTFANAGNNLGIVLTHYSPSAYVASNHKGLTTSLQEIKGTATMTIASPCVVTYASHGLADGTGVSFSTTGALPTGVVAHKIYYSKSTGTDTFNLYTDSGLVNRVNTSGTQSGTHTLWIVRRQLSKTAGEISGITDATSVQLGTYIIPWVWSSGYTVDTTASKWRFTFERKEETGTGTYSVLCTDLTSPMYAAWCDNQVTPVDNADVVIIKDYTYIDKTFTLKGVLGTGNTTVSGCGYVCRNLTQTTADVALLQWENPAYASYTFTMDGILWVSGMGGIRVGTEANPILNAQQAKITAISATTGTATATGIRTMLYNNTGRTSLFLYGEKKTTRSDRTTNEVKFGGTVTVNTTTDAWTKSSHGFVNGDEVSFYSTGTLPTGITADTRYYVVNKDTNTFQVSLTLGGAPIDMSGSPSGTHTVASVVYTANATGWSVGDRISILKMKYQGNITPVEHTIGAISGTQICLRSPSTTYTTATDSPIVNCTGYGILFTNPSGVYAYLGNPCNLVIQGCEWLSYAIYGNYSTNIPMTKTPTGTFSKYVINDNLFRSNSAVFNAASIHESGLEILRNHLVTARINNAVITATKSTTSYYSNSGAVNISNNLCTNGDGQTIILSGVFTSITIDSNEIYNHYNTSSVSAIRLSCVPLSFTNNKIYGCLTTLGAVLSLEGCVNPVLSGNYIDYCVWGMSWAYGNANMIGGSDTGVQFGTETANTYDIMVNGAGYVDYTLTTPNVDPVFDATNQNLLLPGSNIRIYNPAGAATTYKIYQNSGKVERENTTFLNSPSSIKFTTTFTDTATRQFTFLAKNGQTYVIKGNIRYDSNYIGSTYTLPSISVGGLGLTPDTFTAADSDANNWQPFSLSILNDSGIDGLLTVTFTCQSDTATGIVYLDGIVDSPLVTDARFYGYQFNGLLYQTTDPVNVLNEATALALSSEMDMDFGANTLTISGSVSLSNIYDYIKALEAQATNITEAERISSADGSNFIGDFDIVLEATAEITGSGILNIGSNTLTINAGATTTAVIQSDATSFVPVTVAGIVAGSRVQIYNTTTSTEISNGVVAGTSTTVSATYTTAQTIRVRAIKVDGVNAYKMYEATGTLTDTGLSITIAQEVNDVYETNAIDGSTVTECSISGTTIRIYVDDPDNATTFQRIYNWFQYYLSTEDGIADQDTTYFYAIDTTTYKCDNSFSIINQDTTNPLAITGGNCSPESGDITSIIDTSNGASIVVLSDRVVDASGSLDGIKNNTSLIPALL